MPPILLDTRVWGGALPALKEWGHDVIWSGSWDKDPGDAANLNTAHSEQRILVTPGQGFR